MFENQEVEFSVITPVYNVENYVRRCINSVLEQTYPNFELELIDDGSTDNSADICQEFANRDPRIKFIRQKNEGQLSARSTGIKNATGNYYVFLDSDDYLEPQALERIRSAFVKYQCDCVVYDYKRFSEDEGKFIENTEKFPRQRPFVTNNKKEIVSFLFSTQYFRSLWVKAIKANLVSKDTDYSPYYYIRQSEDALQSLEIYRNLTSVAFIDDSLYVYCLRSSSISHTFNFDRIPGVLAVRNAEYDFLHKETGVLFTASELLSVKLALLLSFIGSVMFVCDSTRNVSDKRKVLELMHRSEYFSKAKFDYVQQKKKVPIKKRFVMFFFRRKAFGTLVACCNVFRGLRGFVKILKAGI